MSEVRDESVDPDIVPPPVDRIRVDTGEEVEATRPLTEEEVEEDSPITELTTEERDHFETLLTIGRITRTVEVFGHKIQLTTVTTEDMMKVGLACKDYKGSEGYARAYQSAVVAACIRSVNGESWNNALAPGDEEGVYYEKLAKVRRLYPLVVFEIYQRAMELEAEFAELVNKVGKVKGWTTTPKQ